MKNKIVVTAAAVRTELHRYLEDCEARSDDPVNEVYLFVQVLERRLGIVWTALASYEAGGARQLFDQQVRRALNRAVADGELVKRGERTSLRYLTPAASAVEDQEDQEAAERAAADREKAWALRERLKGLGLDPSRGSSLISLSLADWAQVVALAEIGFSETGRRVS